MSPAVVNPAVTANTDAHFVMTPGAAVVPRNRLFVMLPGTGAIPRFYRQVVRTGSARGWHGIGLTYPNDVAVSDLCAGSPDPDCAGRVRREIITGEDASPLVAVGRDGSVIGRLEDLIVHLHATYPTEGWGGLLQAGRLDWSRVTVAGHSQGSGHAAYLGKLFTLDRVVMFSGPSDVGLSVVTPAPWLSLPALTPASRHYGFTHTADELVPLGLINANWTLLGLGGFGPVTSVDGAGPPYDLSRRLVTSAPPNPNPIGMTPGPNHASPVVDAFTPLDGQGAPLYRPVWTYLAFPEP